MAVLEDAVWCIQKYRLPTDGAGRRLFLDAKHWLLASEPQWPYSFECICAALDLDAEAVLHRLQVAPQRPPVPAGPMPAMRMVGAREMRGGQP